MLTHAEELGLSGLALSSRVQRALYALPESQLAGLIEQLRLGAVERHVMYLHDGALEPVRILPCPITVVPDQLAYIHHVTLTVQNALKRLPTLYLGDPVARESPPPPEEGGRWPRHCRGPSQQRHNPIFGRL